jgi:hypothetical protein
LIDGGSLVFDSAVVFVGALAQAVARQQTASSHKQIFMPAV